MKFLAVFDSLSNKTFACSEKKRAYQNRWTKALCLYYYCVFNFMKVYFLNASSIGGKDRPILFIYANRFKGIETGF